MAVREAVFRRDNWTCQAKGWRMDCGLTLSVHHLCKASQGGRFEEANLLTLCTVHNDAVEDYPQEARSLGLVVKSWERNVPTQVVPGRECVSDNLHFQAVNPPDGPRRGESQHEQSKGAGQVATRSPAPSTKGESR